MIQTVNELVLIVGYLRRVRVKTDFQVNVNRKLFVRFKEKLKLKVPVKFPSCQKDEKDRELIINLRKVQKLNKNCYLAVGCFYTGYMAAVIDANSLEIMRPAIQHSFLLNNFVAYRKLILVALSDCTLFVTGLDTLPEERLLIEDYTLNPSSPGSAGVNYSRNMVIDRSKVYMTCLKKNSDGRCYLVRVNMGSLNLARLKDSRERLDLIELFEVSKESSLHASESNIFVVEGKKITRVNKKSLKITELISPIEGGKFYNSLVAVGTDKYAFVAKASKMFLLRIYRSIVKKVDEVDAAKFDKCYTRMLVPGRFKSVSFVARLFEWSTHLAIYAALNDSLYLVQDQKIPSRSSMISGGMYDADRDQLILSLDNNMSVVIKLTY